MISSTQWYIFVAVLFAVVVRLLGQDLAPIVDAFLPIMRALRTDGEQSVELPSADVVN